MLFLSLMKKRTSLGPFLSPVLVSACVAVAVLVSFAVSAASLPTVAPEIWVSLLSSA